MSASRIALAAFVAAFAGFLGIGVSAPSDGPSEAPASFQMVTNGFVSQQDFLDALEDFSQEATVEPGDEGGLGPTFNGTSCKSCHLNPAPGGGLSRFELRAGRLDTITGSFIAPAGGTLVRQLATDPAAQQRVPEGFFVTKRRSTSLFGLGYIELIPDRDILAVRDAQPPEVRGVATTVRATTGISSDGTLTQVDKVGRFGWKCQQGTLLDFAADALVNEIGRTNPINPDEPLSVDGRKLNQFKKTADPEDAPTADRPFGHDTISYTRLMRALQAPPTDFTLSATDDAIAGGRLFVAVGCAQCHVQTFTTAPVGVAPAGLDKADPARGNKVIHPLSDFLLHDIGTGDTEVVQGGGPETRKMVRTAPLWGVRLVPEMGHDGRWATFGDAIKGHGGQAAGSSARFFALSAAEQKQLLTYLRSR
jgi:CxxC motif-containing protein (DUF1111 family)